MGCPIRKSPDQSLFAAPRRLSQRITSFIASCRQGIHRMPLRHLITLIINVHLFPYPSHGAMHLRGARHKPRRPLALRSLMASNAKNRTSHDHSADGSGKERQIRLAIDEPSIYKTSFLRSIQQPCGQAGFLLECRTLRLPTEVRRSSLQRCQEQAAIDDHRKTVSSSK